MFDLIHAGVTALNTVLYDFYIVPLFLIIAGIFLSVRLGFPQIRHFVEMLRVTRDKPLHAHGISSFGALMVSTASRVGTGNIVGVSTAICLGGAGAIFWMWFITVIGAASAFVESTLAQIYKRHDDVTGHSYGGPSYYIQTALGMRWLGILFSAFVLNTYIIGYNLLAAYNIQDSFSSYSFYGQSSTPIVIGIILAVLFAVCIWGGAKKITTITSYLVPIMGTIYVIVALGVIIYNISNVPAMFATIFKSAFSFDAGFGGFAGSCVMYGIKRGLYSNEAGMGSAPNASASASVSHPVKQGLVQSLSVFIDTLLICSATALMCLSCDVEPTKEISGILYVQKSLMSVLGDNGTIFITFSMCLFGYTTLIGNYYYTEGCWRFILKKEPGKGFMTGWRIFCALLVFLGAIISAGLAWDTADLLQALMVIINVPVIVILAKPAVAALRDYEWQVRKGKSPVYRAEANGVKGTDFWN